VAKVTKLHSNLSAAEAQNGNFDHIWQLKPAGTGNDTGEPGMNRIKNSTSLLQY
jgi:hypothetical protein